MTRQAATARLENALVGLRRAAEGLGPSQLGRLAEALESLLKPGGLARPVVVTHSQLSDFAGDDFTKAVVTRLWNVLYRERNLPGEVVTVDVVRRVAHEPMSNFRNFGAECRRLLVAFEKALPLE